ncbi:MAG: tetratricopeptide repeat protein [Burkholderiaceae bacterium]
MSLINQMLQDLDRRRTGAEANDAAQADIRAVPARDNTLRLLRRTALPVTALLLTALLGAGVAWFLWGQAAPAPVITAAKPAVSAQPSQPNAPPPDRNTSASSSIAPDPLALQEDSTAAPLPTTAIPSSAAQDVLAKDSEPTKEPLETQAAPVKSPTATIAAKPPVAAVPAPVPVVKKVAPAEVANINKNAKDAKDAKQSGEDSAHEAVDSDKFKHAKEVTPQQTTENAYRQAIARIDAGQSAQAIGMLEQVLQRNPTHAAARQTLVGLLLKSKRQDDAVRTLQEGLNIDLAQPGLAMILARLQVERGNLQPALETLQHTLPHAAGQADYQAFLAALLQREKHHQEATAHYAIALRQAPQNGLWWMGYGISLQAENRLAEAQDAFKRAKASNMLSAELKAFVDQKLRQLQP